MADLSPAAAPAPAASNGAVTTPKVSAFLDPSSPELWLVGLGAVMLGLIAVSTSVRIGGVRLSGSIS